MLEGGGMILQGGMQVGLRRMAGITGLHEQRQIGQAKPLRQLMPRAALLARRIRGMTGIEPEQPEHCQPQAEREEDEKRATHLQSRPRTVDRILSTGAPSSSTALRWPSGPTT